MKYIYIAGLEHSGTTLINHLLAQHSKTLGLGEVTSYFEPAHMEQYMSKWGTYADVSLCSCGADWGDCQFWGGLNDLNGLNSDRPLKEKYEKLIKYISEKYDEDTVIIDSSKRFSTLRLLHQELNGEGKKSDFLVIVMVKDVRSFTASIHAKQGARGSFFDYWKTFNWWYGEYQKLFKYIAEQDLYFVPVLYEKLCYEPEQIISSIYNAMGVSDLDDFELGHANSHIAMGNKDFILRNRERIRYDYRWFLDDAIEFLYLLTGKVRRFNKRLYHT